MTTPGGVTFNLRAFKKGFGGGTQALLLDTRDEHELARTALREAIAEHRSLWDRLNAEGKATIMIGDPILAPKGPVCWVDQFKPHNSFEPMLDNLANGLTQRGITGILKPAPSQPHRIYQRGPGHTLLSARVVRKPTELSPDAAPSRWHRYQWFQDYEWYHDDQTSRTLLRAAIAWVLAMDGTTHLSVPCSAETILVEPDTEAILDFCMTAMQRPTIQGSLTSFRLIRAGKEGPARILGTEAAGMLTIAEHHPGRDRRDILADLIDWLAPLAPHAILAVIREGTAGGFGWDGLNIQDHRPPISEAEGRYPRWHYNLPLLTDYVLDAHLHQILTDSQLAKANLPPERWTVTPLGDGRHSVTAKDPEPWLDHSDPAVPQTDGRDWINPPTGVDPAVLDQARTDLGQALLTFDVLRQNPPSDPDFDDYVERILREPNH